MPCLYGEDINGTRPERALYHMYRELRRNAIGLLGVENIIKYCLDTLHGLAVAKAWDGAALNHIKRAQLVYAVDMVGMGVGEEDCVYLCNAEGKGLSAQIRGCIDKDIGNAGIEKNGRPCADVAWRCRNTYRAGAPDYGHTRRGAAT